MGRKRQEEGFVGEEFSLCSKTDETLQATNQAAFSLSPDDLGETAGLLCGLAFLICKMRGAASDKP